MTQVDPGIPNVELERFRREFEHDLTNTLAMNAVTSVGAHNAALDSSKANRVSHHFLNTLKPPGIRATNQASSGRCWMFAGLNLYRYLMIRGLGLERFEYSETYLFFYDKLERANCTIQYFIDNPEARAGDREVDIMLSDYYGDGGYWNFFVNLVDKYGLVPKDCMEETFQSGWTDDMNVILKGHIISCVNAIIKTNRSKRPNKTTIRRFKEQTMDRVYGCLVKFLGQPPTTFDWYFEDANHKSQVIKGLTPKAFYGMVKGVDVKDFVVLVDIPCKKYYQTYKIRNQTNMVGGEDCVVLNLPIHELKKYASLSITKGLPVWFAGDVGKGFGYHKSVLDEEIYNTDLLFGGQIPWTKGEKLELGYTQANHAMTLVGVNVDEKGKTDTWQVENSWGYLDHETPGLDGFLCMSNQWFEDNLVQIAVHKQFLSRNVLKALETEPVVLDPWDYMAPAVWVKGVTKP